MEELKITHTSTRDMHCIPIGVIYLTNPEYATTTNFNFNQYYVRIVDTILEQLSISSFYIVPIGLKLSPTPSATQTAYINAQLNKYPEITRFFCSFPDNFLIVLFEAYFKYNHEKIVFSTGSSGLLVNFQDNVFRFAQNDYPLVNFISNLYFKEPLAFDIIYIPGQFFTGSGAGTTEFIGFEEILTDNKVINEYLATTNRFMVENPFVLTNQPVGMSRTQFVGQMRSALSNPDYYAPGNNFFQTNIQQYTINFNARNNPSFVSKYGLPAMDVIAWKINNLWIDPQSQVPNVQRMSFIEILCVYLVFFDYTQNKDMVFIITNFNFPAFISSVYYYLPLFAQQYNRPDAFNQFKSKARFVLTGLNNRSEYTYDLFTDPQTDTLWYNYGKTWYETIMFFETLICVQRIEQSMFVLLEKMSRDLNMRSGGKYVDISSTPQPAIIAAYNAVEFLYHFVQNGIDVGPFILSYFNNAKLLQYGDNLVFNSNMDNVYGVNLLSYFFYEGTGSIVNRNIAIAPEGATATKDDNLDVFTPDSISACPGGVSEVTSGNYISGQTEYDAAKSTYKSINGVSSNGRVGCLSGKDQEIGKLGIVKLDLSGVGNICIQVNLLNYRSTLARRMQCSTSSTN